ncbi:MAG TPA: hypothetical protein VFT44_01830, partial [Pyrinomonadaceae bacterium]|nr:hypothetical protein [Pyrinomonadaceae bacterium]
MRRVKRRYSIELRAALLIVFLHSFAIGQTQGPSNPENGPTPAATPPAEKVPLGDEERAELLKLIKSLQERVEKLEAAQASTPNAAATSVPVATSTPPEPETSETAVSPAPAETTPKQDDDKNFDGRYTPNLGFKVVNTEYGDMNVSIYTYVRYLNQLGLDSTYTDAFGITKNVQNRQDVQLLKLQIKFLGWMLNPKLRYFLYAWTSNANQGQGAQVVLAGNLQYTFNKYFTLGGGIRSLPGTRSVEGNFPFWTNVDSRHIADEFNRPSYTS